MASAADPGSTQSEVTIRLGLRKNLVQFSLLVLINAFVGAMVGLERAVLPLIAEQDFGLASRSAILSFIASFGVVKAATNLFAGRWSDRVGRKKLLMLGWVIGLPVPLLVIWAPAWSWIVFANILLGINQGLCWSTTVIMKIDLVGPARRGLAMGLNEFAGYLAVALSALATGYIAAAYAFRPQPFYLGVAIVLLGLTLSARAKETRGHARYEAQLVAKANGPSEQLSLAQVFWITSWRDRALFSCSQAGMINNLNDGMAWGLFPLFFAQGGLAVEQIGLLAAVYPAMWGVLQLGTGWLSDRWGRKWMTVSGMITQAAGIWLIAATGDFTRWLIASGLLGIGTALVYPTLLAAVSDVAHPQWRASAVGVYRLWRDGGYALGAVLSGLLADLFGLTMAIALIGALTLFSGIIIALAMHETLPAKRQAKEEYPIKGHNGLET